MLARMGKFLLIFMLGLPLVANVALANQSSPDLEKILKEVETLRTEVSQTRQTAMEARGIALKTRAETAEFKEETLARLGIWRGKLGEGMMLAIEAKDLASRAAEEVKIYTSLVDTLKADVSLAKEMAVSAKIESDQARKEIEELSAQNKKDRELLIQRVNEILVRAKEVEEKLKPEVVKLKPPKNIYEVRRGDSLWRISKYRNIYNDPYQWEKIFKANQDKIENPNLIYPGQELIIPPKKSHLVLKGENLWTIANYESVYNTPYEWRRIYQANRDKLTDPNRVYPGQKLIIPQD
ncbi:LysM peptidoglycan-binding domain-containing protein [Patescibacteria group bacterium]|nr:LysM peptidoglycan-binding domain-containing protein [Patescibacteria group bacterium]